MSAARRRPAPSTPLPWSLTGWRLSPALLPYRVTLERRPGASLEQVIWATDRDTARGACAFLERGGWTWVRTEAVRQA